MRANQRVNWQAVQRAAPSLPLVVQQRTQDVHAAPRRRKHVGDFPIVAAGATRAGHVPGVDDRTLGWLEKRAVQCHAAVGIVPRSVGVDDLEIGHHPVTFAATAAVAPMPRDDVMPAYEQVAALHNALGA